MISRDYIHSMDGIAAVERNYADTMSFIESCLTDIKLLGVEKSNLELFDEYTTESAEYIREGVSAGIKKIGDKIIEIVKRCKEFIKSKLSDLKNLKWRLSSDEKKIDTAISKNPSLADDIKIAIAEGNIKISDIKDLKTFYDEVDNIMKEMKKDQVDPKSLKGRWEKAKKKIASSEKPLKAVLGITASAAGLYLTYTQIKKYKKDSANYVEDVGKNFDAIMSKISTQTDALHNVMRDDPDNRTASLMSLQAQMAAEVERISGKNMSVVTQSKANVVKKLDKIVQKIPMVQREQNKAFNTVARQLGSERFNAESQNRLKKLRERRDTLDDKIASFDKTRTSSTERDNKFRSHHTFDNNGNPITKDVTIGDISTPSYELDRTALQNLMQNRDRVNNEIRDLENRIRTMHRNVRR